MGVGERQGHLLGLRGVGVKISFNRILIEPSGEHLVPTMGVGVGDKKLYLTGFIFVHHQGSTGYPPCGGTGWGVKTSFNQICDCAIRAVLGTHHGGRGWGNGVKTSFNQICDCASGLHRVPTMRGVMKVRGGGYKTSFNRICDCAIQ